MRKDFVQNLVGNFDCNRHELINISDTVNMVLEKHTNGSSVNTSLYSILGMEKQLDFENASCHGIYTCSRGYNDKPCIYVAFGAILYVIWFDDEGNFHKEFVANIPSESEIRFVENGGQTEDTAYVFYVDGSTLHAIPNRKVYGDQSNGVLNIPLPKNYRPTHIAYLWGYLVINNKDTDEMNISYQYPLETKLPLYDEDGIVKVDDKGNILYEDDISTDIFQCQKGHLYPDVGFVMYAEWKPDIIESIVSNGTYLYALGTKSIQKFTYQANVDAPFTSGSGSSSDIGTMFGNTVAKLLDRIFFVGSVHEKENAVYEISQSGSITKISTEPIDNVLKDINTSTCSSFCYVSNSHLFYVLTINGSTTLCYDATTESWTRRESSGHCWRYNHCAEIGGKNLFGCIGALCSETDDNWTEHDGTPILRSRTSGCMTSSLHMFYGDMVEFNLDKHSDMDISYSYAEGGRDWSNTESIKIGSWTDRVTIWNTGIHKILAVKIETSSNSDFGILGGQLTWSELDG